MIALLLVCLVALVALLIWFLRERKRRLPEPIALRRASVGVIVVLVVVAVIFNIVTIFILDYHAKQQPVDVVQPEQFTPEQARALGGLQTCIFGLSIKSLTEHKSSEEFHRTLLEECQKQIERVNEEYDVNRSGDIINYHLNSYKDIQATHGR